MRPIDANNNEYNLFNNKRSRKSTKRLRGKRKQRRR